MIRRLPPTLTKEDLEEQLQPLPELDYLEFFSSDTRFADAVFYEINRKSEKQIKGIWWLISAFVFCSLFPHLFARAYLNFKNQDDIVLFRDRFDGYVFIDNRGLAFRCHYTRHSLFVHLSVVFVRFVLDIVPLRLFRWVVIVIIFICSCLV